MLEILKSTLALFQLSALCLFYVQGFEARQYAEAIDDLTKDYEAGLYSENEYTEKLNELKDAQYKNIEAYYDAQDAIVDLNKTRVDSIKDGIEKELDAYEELIKKKKEALSTEKDLYDFQKNTREQNKNIAELERRIAALSMDQSASGVAQRRRLEAELAQAQQELQDTYYDRSIEQQQTALDRELEDFEAQKDAEIQKWEEYLDNVELVVADSLNLIQENALGIYDTLGVKAEEYNLTLSDAITTPWQDGSLAISDYQTTFDTAMSSATDQLEAMKSKWQEVIDKMAEASGKNVEEIDKENDRYAAAEYIKPPTEVPKQETKPAPAPVKTVGVGSKINAGGAKIYSYAGGQGYNQYYGNDPIYDVIGESGNYWQVRYHKLNSGVTGWFKKSDVKAAYAKGTLGVDRDQWALLDELGDELQLVPDGNGRLAYLKKGTSVIPHDISENLMQLGQLDPSEILERNRPSIGVHPEIHNTEINLSLTYGDMVSIGEFHGDNLADLEKMVEKQFEQHTKNLNQALRKYVR